MSDIKVDTYKLRTYADRIANVNRRISILDRRLDALYSRVGLLGLWNLMSADILVGYSWRLSRCQAYLQDTAVDFEQVEKSIINMTNEPQQGGFGIGGEIDAIVDVGGESLKDLRDWLLSQIRKHQNGFIHHPGWVGVAGLIKEMESMDLWGGQFHNHYNNIIGVAEDGISRILNEADTAGEALGWLENIYGEAVPKWVSHGLEVFLPSSLKEAYTLTSGILQGDLTLEEGWDVAKSLLSKNSKLAVVCESISYTFETGQKRSDEMEKEMLEQLREGDVIGAVIDGAEGFIDTIIGGSVEVLGDVGGNMVDDLLEDKVPILKGVNLAMEYGTGLLGWNDGEGYSVGGLIGHATEKISQGIDVVTDVVTDATNVVTDAVTKGVKSGIKWVKSWFS